MHGCELLVSVGSAAANGKTGTYWKIAATLDMQPDNPLNQSPGVGIGRALPAMPESASMTRASMCQMTNGHA